MPPRPLARGTAAAAAADAIALARQKAGSNSAEDEICPVCKSSRYLNPTMKFLVNPECYHKMCESCVERIFNLGPAQCPVIGCHRTLRKAKFRKQTFEDIKVEREVDIRRRVARVFNKREEDFGSLLEYNNYLEDLEDITFNLMNGVDVEATEARLASYEMSNKSLIQQNAAKAAAESQMQALQAVQAKEQQTKLRQMDMEDAVAERRERAEERREIAAALSVGGESADKIVERVRGVHLKKSSMRRQNQEVLAKEIADERSGRFGFQDNSRDALVVEDVPFDPLDGFTDDVTYFTYHDKYENPWVDSARLQSDTQAGGYFVDQYCERTLFEAFSGLGCFIGEEPPTMEGIETGNNIAMSSEIEVL